MWVDMIRGGLATEQIGMVVQAGVPSGKPKFPGA